MQAIHAKLFDKIALKLYEKDVYIVTLNDESRLMLVTAFKFKFNGINKKNHLFF